MEVRLYPNSRRPDVGLRPRRESQRPLLPQHARHCPVLEAGSALGYLVYPPLKENESYHVEYQGEGRYQFVYYLNPAGAQWDPIFSVTFILPVGGMGTRRQEVQYMIPEMAESTEAAVEMAEAFMVPGDLGTPPGAVTLRGAWNFQTPDGWDTVYTPVLNVIERPIAPVFSIRVETDWYPHETEFRYVLQPGEGLSGSHGMPIGQAFFVPREEITLRDCTAKELEQLRAAREEFSREKAAATQRTPYGLPYSPHYLKRSREQK